MVNGSSALIFDGEMALGGLKWILCRVDNGFRFELVCGGVSSTT